MKNLFSLTLILLTLCTAGSALAQNPDTAHGKEVFDKWCTPCHGPAMNGTLPGTLAISLKYRGDLPPLLEERTDLSPDFIRTIVRNGLYGMPLSRKTEVSESDLNDVIAYLLER